MLASWGQCRIPWLVECDAVERWLAFFMSRELLQANSQQHAGTNRAASREFPYKLPRLTVKSDDFQLNSQRRVEE